MAGDRDPHRLQRVLRDREGGDAAERGVAARQQGAVERRQRDQRIAGQRRGGAQRVAGLGGDRRGPGTAAGDVADHQHPASGRRKGVVEVSADLVLGAGRPVGGGHRPAGDMRQRGRQEATLQRLGDLRPRLFGALEVGEEAGVVEGQGDAAGEDAGEVGRPPAGSAYRTRRRRASALRSACPRARSGDGDRRANAEAAQELEILAVVVGEARAGRPRTSAR